MIYINNSIHVRFVFKKEQGEGNNIIFLVAILFTKFEVKTCKYL